MKLPEPKVVVANKNSREANIDKILDLLKEDIRKELKNVKDLVIKPNFVNIHYPAGATKKETVEEILKFLKPIYNEKITIAEGCGIGDSIKAFEKFGYTEFKDKYNVEFVNLNKDKTKKVYLYNQNLEKKLSQDISKTILNSDFLISPALMKTHDSVIVTLGLKNILVGALQQKYQFDFSKTIHQGYKAINKSLFELAKLYHPHLTIIDGWEMMEGSGPSHGDLVEGKIAIGSLNFLAADIIASYLMGFNPKKVGYLNYCMNHWNLSLEDVKVIGAENWKGLRKKLKAHPSYKSQKDWRVE